MPCKIRLFVLFFLLLISHFAFSQSKWATFSTPDTSLNKKKLTAVVATKSLAFGSALVVLNHVWYRDFPRSNFHTFNDGKEWLQMDKAGHAFSAYFLSRWTTQLYLWSGLSPKNSALIGTSSALIMMSSIEFFDAFSDEWGFSGWDFGANTFGAGLFLVQELTWHEQRIMLKTSYLPKNYNTDEIKTRTNKLYGTSFLEQYLKDYNGQTSWASVNIASFINRENRFPKWLNVSFGYGAEGLLGGFDNRWCNDASGKLENCPLSLVVDRNDIDRYRQYFISLDVDFTKIQTRRKGLKALFGMLNIVKVPFPAIEFNSKDKIKWNPIR